MWVSVFSHRAARVLSIVGHPALLMPGAVVGSAVAQGAPAPVVWVAGVASLGVAIGVGLYSALQVRAGRWQHVDASIPSERRQLHLVLAVMLFGMAALMGWCAQPGPVVWGLALGGVLVAVAHGLRAWLKVSLHVGFAVFAGALVWPHPGAVASIGVLTVGVCWSRLALRRHTRSEVGVGLLAGAAVGLAFQFILQSFRA